MRHSLWKFYTDRTARNHFSKDLSIMKILFQLLLCVTLTLAITSSSCPSSCRCSNQMTNVQCVDQVLFEIPRLPSTTERLDISNIFLGPNLDTNLGYMHGLKNLDMSRNIIVRISNSTFRGLHNLTYLDVSGNRLQSLEENVFQDNPQLEVLDLSDNGLSFLSEAFYKNLPRLRELYLSGNNFFQLKLGLRFQVLNQLQILDLSSNDFGDVSNDAFENIHQWSSTVHRKLILANCKITSVENGTFVPYRGLWELDLSGISTLDSGNLSLIMKDLQETNTHRLHMSSMEISDVDSIFTSAPRLALEYLDMSRNQIENAAPNAFNHLGSVHTLDMSHNNIKLLLAAFTTLGNLISLDISHNKLKAFSGPSVSRLSKLEILKATHNEFDVQSNLQLDSLRELKILDLSHNTLDKIVTAGSNAKLEQLILVSNNITSLDMIPESMKLKILDISGNKITSLGPYTFSSSINIETIDLSYNEISDIDQLAFLPNSSIAYNINLSGNKLTTINFGGWGSARLLNFSHNAISRVDFHAFLGMNNLEVLDLSHNKIKTFEDETFDYLINLETLKIDNNHLVGTSDQKQIKNTFANLISLKNLDLSHNNISHLDSNVFDGNPEISSLILSYNKFPMLSPDLVKNLKKLTELDIASNPFMCNCHLLPLIEWLNGIDRRHSTTFNCSGPPARAGRSIFDYKVEFLECDRDLLEIIVFGTLGGLTILVGIIGTVVCRLYSRWSESAAVKKEKEKRMKMKKETKNKKIKGTCTVEELPLEVLDELDHHLKKKHNGHIANGGPLSKRQTTRLKAEKLAETRRTKTRESSRSRSKSKDKQSRSRSKSKERPVREKRERDRLRGFEKELRYMMARYQPSSRWDADGRDRWASLGDDRLNRREYNPEKADRFFTMPSNRRRQTLLDDLELRQSEYSRVHKPYSPRIHRHTSRPRYSQDDIVDQLHSPAHRFDIVRAPRKSNAYDPHARVSTVAFYDPSEFSQPRTLDARWPDVTAGVRSDIRDRNTSRLMSQTRRTDREYAELPFTEKPAELTRPRRQEREYVELPFPDRRAERPCYNTNAQLSGNETTPHWRESEKMRPERPSNTGQEDHPRRHELENRPERSWNTGYEDHPRRLEMERRSERPRNIEHEDHPRRGEIEKRPERPRFLSEPEVDIHRIRSYGSIDFKAKKRRFEENEKEMEQKDLTSENFGNDRNQVPDIANHVEAEVHSETSCRTPDPDYPIEDKKTDWI